MKKLGILTALFCCTTALPAHAWWGDAVGLDSTHLLLAEDIMYGTDSLRPYFRELARRGYNLSHYAYNANHEPDPQHGWGWFFDTNRLYQFSLSEYGKTSEYGFGALLHGIADSAVPAKHAPCEVENDWMHLYFEQHARASIVNYWGQPWPSEYLYGDYESKRDGLWALKYASATDFANDYEPIDEHRLRAAKLQQIAADAILKQYFDHMDLLTPSWVVADWTFDEGDPDKGYGNEGQFVYSHSGSINANLVRGWSEHDDIYDGFWDEGYGLNSGSFHGSSLAEAGGAQTYLRSYDWTGYEGQRLTSSDSYSIEMIVSPDSIPTSDAVNNDNPSTLINFYDAAGSSSTQWWLRGFRKINVGAANLHTAISFGVETRDGGGRPDLFVDLSAAGMSVYPGRWYYIGINYDYNNPGAQTGTLTMTVKDLTTNVSASNSITARRMQPMNSNSRPMFLVGGESNDYDLRPFDGRIDRLRIGTRPVAGNDRLHGSPTVAFWKFNESSSQYCQSDGNSSSLRLRLGEAAVGDVNEPKRMTYGFLNGNTIQGNRGTTNGYNSKYAVNDGWTRDDVEAMMTPNSFTIEAVVKPEAYRNASDYAPGWDISGYDNPMYILRNSIYEAGGWGRGGRYELTTYKDTDNRIKFKFFYTAGGSNLPGTGGTIVVVPEEQNVPIALNQWYYVSVTFSQSGNGTGQMILTVRNMSNGATASGVLYGMPPLAIERALDSNNPNLDAKFLVGSSGSVNVPMNFAGQIDAVRISNVALPAADRLYNIRTMYGF